MTIGNTVSASALRAQLWSKKLWKDVIDDLFFQKAGFMGSDGNSIVHVMDDLTEVKGDRITVPLTTKLSGDGTDGDSELEGQEEIIAPYSDAVLIGLIRHAVRTTGALDDQKNCFNIREDAKNKLKIWLKEFIEKQFFFKLGGVNNTSLTNVAGVAYAAKCAWSNAPDQVPAADTLAGYGARYLQADYVGGGASLAATDLITPALISHAREKAVTASPKVRPVSIDGKNYYVLFVHPRQMYDLQQNPVWNQAMREAEIRGKSNPLFTHVSAIWDGVMVIEHEYVPFLDISVAGHNFNSATVGTDLGAVDVYRALLCGAQALVMAKCRYDNAWVEKKFDYDNKDGIATGFLGGIQKVTFNSKDYGVVCLDTAATALV